MPLIPSRLRDVPRWIADQVAARVIDWLDAWAASRCPRDHYVRVDAASKQDVAELREVLRMHADRSAELQAFVDDQHALIGRMATALDEVIETQLPAIKTWVTVIDARLDQLEGCR
jgi:hypothetical protein